VDILSIRNTLVSGNRDSFFYRFSLRCLDAFNRNICVDRGADKIYWNSSEQPVEHVDSSVMRKELDSFKHWPQNTITDIISFFFIVHQSNFTVITNEIIINKLSLIFLRYELDVLDWYLKKLEGEFGIETYNASSSE
jgi:hypothetical protein